MRPRLWIAIVIFLSAYSPLSIIFLIQDYDADKYILNNPITIYTLLGLSALSVVLLWITIRSIKQNDPPVNVVKVKNRSTELVNYSIPYMISFFVMDVGDLKLLLSFGLFMLLMFVVTHRTHNIFVNPILAIFGYNLYDVTYEVDGSKREEQVLVRSHKPLVGDKLRLAEISDYLFLATDINPEV